jgi:Na+/melibiose symporter-like transporter
LPIDGIALVVLYFFLKVEIKTIPLVEGIRTLDWVGFLLVIGGTISFLYGLEVGSSGMSPWGSAKVICLIVFGFLLLAGFMVWEANFTKYPVVPFRIFKQRTNIAAYLVACLHGFVFISFDFFLPLYFQVVLGLKPLISGVTLFALILPLAASTMGGGAVTRKTGNYKILIVGGSLLMCLGCGLFILFEPRRNWPKIILLQVVAGLGAGTMFQSPMIALQSYLRQKDTAAAMAAFSFLRTLFTSMSQVIGTVLMQRTLGSSSTSLVPGGSNGAIDKNKYVEALHIMWAFYTAVAGLIIICSFFIKQRPKTEQPATTPPNGGLEEAKRDAQSPEELVGSENDVKP